MDEHVPNSTISTFPISNPASDLSLQNGGDNSFDLPSLIIPDLEKTSNNTEFPLPVHKLFDNQLGLVTPAGVVPSLDKLFRRGVFSRDFLMQVLDLDPWMPHFIEKGIFHTASYMARDKNDLAESRGFGHLAHEVRLEYFGPARVSQADRDIIKELGPRWWGSDSELFYYAMADIGPQFVRAILRHVELYGPQILEQEILHVHAPANPQIRRAGWDTFTLRDVVLANIRLLADELEHSKSGLYEFYRTNPQGQPWKIMRDGATSIIHPDGSLANANGRIATVELQGLAYDALKQGANYFANLLPNESHRWRDMARQIQRNTMAKLWLDSGNEGYFALGLDQDPVTGEMRHIKTDSSAQFELLDTTIFDDLPLDEQQFRISCLMRRQRSSQYLSDVGILMISNAHQGIIPYAGYQLNQTVWGVTNFTVARGNDYQGFAPLGKDLRNRQVNASAIANKTYEYLYVVDGQAYYRYRELGKREQMTKNEFEIVATNVPEAGHGFTLSGLMRAYYMQVEPRQLAQAPTARWREELLRELLHESPVVNLISSQQAQNMHQRSPIAAINTAEGKRLERQYVTKFNLNL